MSVPLEILQNLLMGVPPVAKLASRCHRTGLNADCAMARRVFDLYCRFQTVVGKDILEIGPGHTLEVLEEAGLVESRRQGRYKLLHLNAEPLESLTERWLRQDRQHRTT